MNMPWLKITSSIESLTKPLYVSGVDIIEGVQSSFQMWEPVLHVIYQLADPWVLYFIIFPMMYYNSMRMGLRLVWAAAVTQYVCSIFKLLLHGHRPYWYFYEPIYHMTAPKIKQFKCETTPGSPSERIMLTACITHILAEHYCSCKGLSAHCERMKYLTVWTMYFGFQILLLVTTSYFASTFPHQAFFSSVMGTLISKRMYHTNVLSVTAYGFAWMMIAMLLTLYTIYSTLEYFGLDPAWSMAKASLACVKISWSELYRFKLIEDTIRATGFLAGVGICVCFCDLSGLKITDSCPCKVKLVHSFVGITFCLILDAFLVPPIFLGSVLHYCFQLVKYAVLPVLITTDVPMMSTLSQLLVTRVCEGRFSKEVFDRLAGDPMIPSYDTVGVPCPLDQDECVPCGFKSFRHTPTQHAETPHNFCVRHRAQQ